MGASPKRRAKVMLYVWGNLASFAQGLYEPFGEQLGGEQLGTFVTKGLGRGAGGAMMGTLARQGRALCVRGARARGLPSGGSFAGSVIGRGPRRGEGTARQPVCGTVRNIYSFGINLDIESPHLSLYINSVCTSRPKPIGRSDILHARVNTHLPLCLALVTAALGLLAASASRANPSGPADLGSSWPTTLLRMSTHAPHPLASAGCLRRKRPCLHSTRRDHECRKGAFASDVALPLFVSTQAPECHFSTGFWCHLSHDALPCGPAASANNATTFRCFVVTAARTLCAVEVVTAWLVSASNRVSTAAHSCSRR